MSFAGPGRYTGGEPGSPIVALEAALTHQAKLPSELLFLFIEKENDRADHLEGEIANLKLTSSFKVQVERGTFADKLGSMLDALDKTSSQIAPTFALIDPFGFSGIPYALIQRLLSKNKCTRLPHYPPELEEPRIKTLTPAGEEHPTEQRRSSKPLRRARDPVRLAVRTPTWPEHRECPSSLKSAAERHRSRAHASGLDRQGRRRHLRGSGSASAARSSALLRSLPAMEQKCVFSAC